MLKKKEGKQLLRFIGWAGMIYSVLLIFAFAGGIKPYAAFVRTVNQSVFEKVRKVDRVQFLVNDRWDRERFDVNVIISDMKANEEAKKALIRANRTNTKIPAKNFTFSSLRFAYLPMIFVFALVGATPMASYKQKFRSLLVGFLIVSIFIFIKLYLCVLIHSESFTEYSHFWQQFFRKSHYVFVADMTMRMIIPVAVWILVAFQVSNWQLFISGIKSNSVKTDRS